MSDLDKGKKTHEKLQQKLAEQANSRKDKVKELLGEIESAKKQGQEYKGQLEDRVQEVATLTQQYAALNKKQVSASLSN